MLSFGVYMGNHISLSVMWEIIVCMSYVLEKYIITCGEAECNLSITNAIN